MNNVKIFAFVLLLIFVGPVSLPCHPPPREPVRYLSTNQKYELIFEDHVYLTAFRVDETCEKLYEFEVDAYLGEYFISNDGQVVVKLSYFCSEERKHPAFCVYRKGEIAVTGPPPQEISDITKAWSTMCGNIWLKSASACGFLSDGKHFHIKTSGDEDIYFNLETGKVVEYEDSFGEILKPDTFRPEREYSAQEFVDVEMDGKLRNLIESLEDPLLIEYRVFEACAHMILHHGLKEGKFNIKAVYNNGRNRFSVDPLITVKDGCMSTDYNIQKYEDDSNRLQKSIEMWTNELKEFNAEMKKKDESYDDIEMILPDKHFCTYERLSLFFSLKQGDRKYRLSFNCKASGDGVEVTDYPPFKTVLEFVNKPDVIKQIEQYRIEGILDVETIERRGIQLSAHYNDNNILVMYVPLLTDLENKRRSREIIYNISEDQLTMKDNLSTYFSRL